VDVTWFAPVAVLLVGAVAAVVLVRQLVSAVSELDASQRRFRRIEHALIPVRVETRRARASIGRIDHR
jgi:cytochrome c-type biogenesis protein CcmH/NrfF